MTDHIIQISQVDEMTASDLISCLQAFPPDFRVVFPRDEGGFSGVLGLKEVSLCLDVNDEYWYGKHDWPESISPEERESKVTETCILLVR